MDVSEVQNKSPIKSSAKSILNPPTIPNQSSASSHKPISFSINDHKLSIESSSASISVLQRDNKKVQEVK